MSIKNLEYILITPAYNEMDFIPFTIYSVVNQTYRPKRWVIVNDGSIDDSQNVISKAIQGYDWITLLNCPMHEDRQFAAKVHAFNKGFKLIENESYDIIGNLDADVSFDSTFFEYLIGKFIDDEKLGVAGTPFCEGDYLSSDGVFSNKSHVSGACQLFRKKCFEMIGGYKPIKGGGIDWAAVTSARMLGWKTQCFTDKVYFHHRKMGTAKVSFLMSRFNHGVKDYYLGGHFLWETTRAIYQMTKKPYFIAGLYLFSGYLYAMFTKKERPLPKNLIQFHQKEQLERLRRILKLNVYKNEKELNNYNAK